LSANSRNSLSIDMVHASVWCDATVPARFVASGQR
jgi:hypothetical protein